MLNFGITILSFPSKFIIHYTKNIEDILKKDGVKIYNFYYF